ncbi:MAG: hypothetical protein H6832_10040 [Planctomycetes bacterium]|nr:hypothetical protein [Planctomycetota bacterium]MCB9918729.1 hypothetical protein [Planctomycetota bacterium]
MTAATALILATVLTSQSRVYPTHWANAEGNHTIQKPFTSGRLVGSVGYRYLQILDGVPTSSIQGLRFRRNGNAQSAFKAVSLTLEITASVAKASAASPWTTIDANHGSSKTIVRRLAILNLPATTARTPLTLPSPFEYDVPFDKPYGFAGGNLALEFRVTSRGNAAIDLDACRGSNVDPNPLANSLGAGCKAYGETSRVSLSHGISHSWQKGTTTWTFSGDRLPPSGVVVLALGFDNARWGALPLPLTLPGTSNATSGACTLFISPDVTAAFPVQANGRFSQTFSLGLDMRFHGLDVHAQLLAPDARANAFGWIVSNAVSRHWIAPWTPVATSYVDEVGGSATVHKHEGLILELR